VKISDATCRFSLPSDNCFAFQAHFGDATCRFSLPSDNCFAFQAHFGSSVFFQRAYWLTTKPPQDPTMGPGLMIGKLHHF